MFNFTIYRRSLLTVALLAAALAGCGGGGGSAAVNTDIDIDGLVEKGTLANARISAFRVTSGVINSTPLVTTTSDANGRYTLRVPSGVPVVIRASVLPGTTLRDEATGSILTAAEIEPPGTNPPFSLDVAVVPTPGSRNVAHITPFTDVAAAQARDSAGGYTTANVNSANGSIIAQLGFNPLTATPTFMVSGNNTVPTNAAAAANASISRLASTMQLGCTQATQAMRLRCVLIQINVNKLNAVITGVVQTAVNTVLANASITSTVTLMTPTMTPTTPATTTTSSFTMPLPPTNPAGTGTTPTMTATTAIQEAATFFTALRSNQAALDADNMSLASELRLIGDSVDMSNAPFDNDTLDSITAMTEGAQFFREVKAGTRPFAATFTFNTTPFFMAGCTLFTDASMAVEATNVSNANSIGCSAQGQTQFITQNPQALQPWFFRNRVVVLLTPTDSSNNVFTVNSRVRRSTFYAGSNLMSSYEPGSNPSLPGSGVSSNFPQRVHSGPFPGRTATLTLTPNGNELSAFVLTGQLAPLYTLPGGNTFTSINYLGTATQADIRGSVVNTARAGGGSDIRVNLSGRFDHVLADGTMPSRAELSPGSFVALSVDGQDRDIPGSESFQFLIRTQAPAGGIIGSLQAGTFTTTMNGESLPSRLIFNGSVFRSDSPSVTRTVFAGSVTVNFTNLAMFNSQLPTSSSNFPVQVIDITGQVVIPQRPTLDVTATLNGNAMQNTISGQYRQNGQIVNVTGTQTLSTGRTILMFNNTAGIEFSTDSANPVSNVTRQGAVIGTLNTNTSRITYTDSSFTQF